MNGFQSAAAREESTADADCWPNLYFIGAPKSGTTYVSELLAQHPDIYCPPLKEPNFMNTDIRFPELPDSIMLDDGQAYPAAIRDDKTYLSAYESDRRYPVRADCSVLYLYSRTAPANIAAHAPDARLMALVRNPIERAYSQYRAQCAAGWPLEDFETEMERQIAAIESDEVWERNFVSTGFYDEQLKRYLEHFPSDAIMVRLYVDMVSDLKGVMDGYFRHAGLEAVPVRAPPPVNQTKIARFARMNRFLYQSRLKQIIACNVPRWIKEPAKALYYSSAPPPSMSDSAYRRLAEVFRDHVVELGRMLERDLTPWLTCGKSVAPLTRD
jgi:hypothetical protein